MDKPPRVRPEEAGQCTKTVRRQVQVSVAIRAGLRRCWS